ncbi:MAG: 2-oxoacid:acceptor oxidoreductase subunit alpha [Candidatus Kariarchaeaceae archaeon]
MRATHPKISESKSRFAMRWGGVAGDGLQSTGLLIQKYFNRLGYYVHGFPGTQSTIRGGHVWQHIELSSKQIPSYDQVLDLLVGLNNQTLEIHLKDIKNDGFIIYNSDKVKIEDFSIEISTKKLNLLPVPLTTLARQIDRKTGVLANTIAVGILISLLKLPVFPYEQTLYKRFRGNKKVLEMNIDALSSGISYFTQSFQFQINLDNPSVISSHKIVVSGNESIALAAAASGLKFLAQYPITPASSILKYLSNRAEKFGMVVKQAEDELAAVTMCIGASYAGVRSMTASSGPGLSLMGEAFGYASMTETPLVIVNSMRAGPSTGIPTKMEQADLNSMIHLSHGESPRAIFAPRNIKEAFDVTVKAFNIADIYQLPVIILSDFALSEQTASIEPFDLNVHIDRGKIWNGPTEAYPVFKRYQFTEDGISPRAIPSTEDAMHILVGAEHDQESHSLSGNRCGFPHSGELRSKMFEKRFKKLELLREEMAAPEIYGITNADYTILCWGSVQGAMMDAIDQMNKQTNQTWNMLSFVDLFPLPYSKIKPLLTKIKHSIMFEVNFTGQFEGLLHQHLDWKADERIHPLTGENPTASSIISDIQNIIKFDLEQAVELKSSFEYYSGDEGATAR